MKLTPNTQPWPSGRYTRYRSRNGCVHNAMMLAWDHPDKLTVAKGYTLDAEVDLWFGHWWCLDEDGRVVDPTWKNEGRAYVALETIDPIAYAKRLGARAGAGGFRRSAYWELELDQIAPMSLVPELVRAWREAPS